MQNEGKTYENKSYKLTNGSREKEREMKSIHIYSERTHCKDRINNVYCKDRINNVYYSRQNKQCLNVYEFVP